MRLLHEGSPVDTLAWTPLDAFIEALEHQVPSDLLVECMSS